MLADGEQFGYWVSLLDARHDGGGQGETRHEIILYLFVGRFTTNVLIHGLCIFCVIVYNFFN